MLSQGDIAKTLQTTSADTTKGISEISTTLNEKVVPTLETMAKFNQREHNILLESQKDFSREPANNAKHACGNSGAPTRSPYSRQRGVICHAILE